MPDTPAESPAAVLRRAADKIGKLAEVTLNDLEASDYWKCYEPDRAWSDGLVNGFGGVGGDFAAVMSPAVGRELARWLASAARNSVADPHAVAVARAVLGGGS